MLNKLSLDNKFINKI